MSQVKAHEKNIRWNALSLVLFPLYVWTIDKHKELYPLNLDDWTEINFWIGESIWMMVMHSSLEI